MMCQDGLMNASTKAVGAGWFVPYGNQACSIMEGNGGPNVLKPRTFDSQCCLTMAFLTIGIFSPV